MLPCSTHAQGSWSVEDDEAPVVSAADARSSTSSSSEDNHATSETTAALKHAVATALSAQLPEALQPHTAKRMLHNAMRLLGPGGLAEALGGQEGSPAKSCLLAWRCKSQVRSSGGRVDGTSHAMAYMPRMHDHAYHCRIESITQERHCHSSQVHATSSCSSVSSSSVDPSNTLVCGVVTLASFATAHESRKQLIRVYGCQLSTCARAARHAAAPCCALGNRWQ